MVLYRNKYNLYRYLEIILCENLILSQFNYCDIIYDPYLANFDSSHIQIVHNPCLKLIHSMKENDSISHTLFPFSWLSIKNLSKILAMLK